MPREGWYSNKPEGGRYIVRTQQRVSKPYVSGGFQSGLTPKERMARQLNKQAGGMGIGGVGTSPMTGNTMLSGADNFFSPQLSTDFLELPQTLREKREIYRHFYNTDELVGQAIDLHTELPLSKVRLAPPKPRTCPKGFKDPHDYGQYILSRFERMCQRVKLFQRLIMMVHHYWLDGTCLAKETLVTVEGGVKEACDVEVGDRVLTHHGRWRAVTRRLEHEAPCLLSIKIARLPDALRVTPNHPIEVLHLGLPRFVDAAEVSKGDFVRVTWPTETEDVLEAALLDHSTPSPLAAYKLRPAGDYNIERDWHFRAAKSVEINEDLLYVLGYWLGDGTIGRDSSRGTQGGRGLWSIVGHDCSVAYLDRVEAALGRILGSTAVTRRHEIRDDVNVHTLNLKGNPEFVAWWARSFGETSHGDNPKKVPPWVLKLPEAKQLALLAGLIDSDGCLPRTHVGGVEIGLTSLNLISAARDIMLRLGAVPSLMKSDHVGEEVIRGRVAIHRYPSYVLRVGREAESRLLASKACKAPRLDEAPRFFESWTSHIQIGDCLYFEVRDVAEEPGEKVYNLQVQEDETFRAHFVSTHNCAIFAEDSAVDTPMDVGHSRRVEKRSELTDNGEAREFEEEVWTPKDDAEPEELAHYQKNYEGWQRLIILPIDKVKITTFSFTDKVKIELIPSDRDRALLDKAKQGDPVAQEMAEQIPIEVRQYMDQGQLIPMGTDPDEGSFVHLLTGRKNADSEVGQSILDRCLRTLYYREKLRQAQTSIASRAMTPKRIVWAEGLSDADTEQLRQQVDLALVDPDYSIVANYEIRWEEMGSRDRLLDLNSEYEQTERRLLSGLGVTESLMSGESLYSGDRLKLEVINTRYLHLREIIQDYVEESLFKPVARRMGFVEKDQWGQEVVLSPRLSFTRLPLRDSQDTFDALFNLYQKGSISVDLILEMLNIDADETKAKLERDLFTVNDAMFNEIIRAVGNEVGRMLAEKTDVTERVAQYLKLTVKPAPAEAGGDEGGGRYG